MKFVEEAKPTEKKIVLVGIRIDGHSRELLSWALVKVADSGDQVVAVHVSRNSDSTLEDRRLLDGYLEVYEGLCNVKKVNLTGQILTGTSVRKILVREAKICFADTVIVGINRQNPLRHWASIAKYCAKHLPPTTDVLAIHNGKVVFRRSDTHLSGLQRDPRPSLYQIGNHVNDNQSEFGESDTSEIARHSYEVTPSSEYGSRHASRDTEDDILSPIEEHKKRSLSSISVYTEDLVQQSPGWPLLGNASSVNHVDEHKTLSLSLISFNTEDLVEQSPRWPLFGAAIQMSPPFEEHKTLSLSSISLHTEDLTEETPGWPLLRHASQMSPQSRKARKQSVVQWVMSLPNRSLPGIPESNDGLTPDEEGNPLDRVMMDNLIDNGDMTSLSKFSNTPENLELLNRINSSGCKWFNHEILKSSTFQFSSDNLIGKGGYSRVYKGFLPDGKPVAVKILKSSEEAWKDFTLEVDIMTSLNHKSITPLLGISVEDNDLVSVYDFLSKGSLEENLQGNNKEKSVLPWEVRFNVAFRIAEALNYLHNECSRPVIHRDVKSSNILLTDEFEPQLSDFGLAIWGPTTSYFLTHSDVVGTFGYLAPEYFMYGKVSDKIDVYSFGVVLLELLSGRKPINSETPKGQESLVMWAKPKLDEGDLAAILDPLLDNNVNEVQMQRMALAATLCLTRAARLRPKMDRILKILKGEEDMARCLNAQFGERNDSENQDNNDDEVYPESRAESHLGLALLDVDDNSTSFSSMEQSSRISLEEYLKGRWSRASSLD